MLHVVHQDHLYQELGQNILDIMHIRAEEEINAQNQHQYMDQLMKFDLHFLYLKIHFIWIPHAVSKGIIIFCH